MSAGLAKEETLSLTIEFRNITTGVALPRGISGVYFNDLDSFEFGLIDYLLFKIVKTPRLSNIPIALSNRGRLANTLEIFKGYSHPVTLCSVNNLFRYLMIHVFSESRFFSPCFGKFSFSRFCFNFLKVSSIFSIFFPRRDHSTSRINIAQTINSDIINASIYSKKSVCFLQFFFRNITGSKQIKIPVPKNKVSLAPLKFQLGHLFFPTNKGDFNPSINSGNQDKRIIKIKSKNPRIVGNGTIPSKLPLCQSVFFIRVCDFRYGPYAQLRRKGVSISNHPVKNIMYVKLFKDTSVKGHFRNTLAYLVKSFNGFEKVIFDFLRGQEFSLDANFHSTYYNTNIRNAIPPRPKERGILARKPMKFKVMSFFSGVGGFELGLPKDKTEVVGFSEVNPYCSDVLRYRFEGIKNYGDITKINAKELPYADIYVGGFPCQNLSIAGNRNGLAGSQSGLFYNFIEIIKTNRPNYFILENVKGLLNCNGGRDFGIVQASLADAGYDFRWHIFNARDFDIPQNRERVYIIGYIRTSGGREVLCQKGLGRSVPVPLLDVTSGEKSNSEKGPFIQTRFLGRNGPLTFKICPTIMSSDIPHLIESPPMKRLGDVGSSGQAFRVYDPNGSSSNLGANAGGTGAKTGLYLVPSSPDLNMVGFIDRNCQGYRVYDSDGCSASLASNSGGLGATTGIYQNPIDKRIRRLTPLECERLMNWPDNHTKFGRRANGDVYTIVDTQRYKMCGNGVVSKIVKFVFEAYIEQSIPFDIDIINEKSNTNHRFKSKLF